MTKMNKDEFNQKRRLLERSGVDLAALVRTLENGDVAGALQSAGVK